VKNEIVAKSNRKPTKNVFPNTKKLVFTSEKFQIRKLIRTKKDRIRNKTTKALRSANLLGNNVYTMEYLLIEI